MRKDNNEQKKIISDEIKSQFSVLDRQLMEKMKSAVNNKIVQNGSIVLKHRKLSPN